MKTKYLALSCILALSALSTAAQACTPAHTFKTVTPGKLTIAIYSYPPFSVTQDENGQIGGIDAEIAKKVAADNCLEAQPMIVDPAATVQAVVSGKADVAVGAWDRTAARSKVLGLSAPTYLDPMGIYSKDGIDSIAGLVGKNVGTVQGYVWVADLQKVLGDKLKLYPNPQTLSQDLEAGRIDVAVDGYTTGAYGQHTGGFQDLKIVIAKPDDRVAASAKSAQSNILYTKGNEGLGEALDDVITTWHKDGTITKWVTDKGFQAGLADVGEPRLVE
jgi:polar amino acid transport system substrate-binding protein